ncbi:MAG TPA: pitrilysin family protein [Myxococcales bacterium]|nr:pitrilysin family protein [Myxococcales bacterium]
MLAAAILLAAGAALPEIPFEKYQLGNGLTVILSEDHRAPVVGVDVWYHVGAVNERKGRSGFAHLFEHLMFQGSKHLNGDERTVFAMFERNGATNLNGTTEWDRTNYFETMPADRLELALWVESDRMGFLLDTVDQKKLDTQRDVVRNERRQSIENVPYGRAEERLVQLLYPEPNPYFGYVIGSHEDLQRASLDDVREFFRTYYAPDNASLAIVGDFRLAEVKPLVEKYFGPLPRGPHPPPVTAKTEPHTAEIRETLRDQVQLPKVLMGWVGPAPLQNPAVAPLMRILAAGKSSRLYHRLVYEKKIAQDVSASWDPSMQLGGIIEITATVQAGHTPEEVAAALDAEIRGLRDAPPTPDELERAKRNLRSGLFAQLENVGGFGGKADQLNYYEMWAHDPGAFSSQLETTLAVTPAQVQEAARRYLQESQRVVITVLPEQKQASAGGAR